MIGRLLRRAIDLRRYENGVALRVVALLQDARDDIVRQLASIDPTQGAKERRLRMLLREVDDIVARAYTRLDRVSRADLRALGPVMGEAAQGDIITGETVAVANARLQAIADTELVRGWPLSKWWKGQGAATAAEFERQMRIGMTEGETIDQLMRRVRGLSVGGGRYAGGIMDTSTRQATTLVRTAVNQVANRAQSLVYEANGVEWYRYVAILDDRTTDRCRSLDDKVFPVADPAAPRPPQHWNCRSSTVPADGPDAPRERPDEWFRKQPPGEQDDMVGATRGRMFRDGKITMREAVAREGRTLTIGQLQERIVRDAGLSMERVQAAERALVAEGAALRRSPNIPRQGWAR